MAGKVGGGGGKGMQPNSEPNVIPFIDIMLVLLIIFMVAAPMPTVDIKIDLPPPGKLIYVEPTDKPTNIALIDAGGVMLVYIENELVPNDQFAQKLMEVARRRNPSYAHDLGQLFSEAKIFIDADQETKYSNVISLINQIDGIGFKKVSLLVKSAAT